MKPGKKKEKKNIPSHVQKFTNSSRIKSHFSSYTYLHTILRSKEEVFQVICISTFEKNLSKHPLDSFFFFFFTKNPDHGSTSSHASHDHLYITANVCLSTSSRNENLYSPPLPLFPPVLPGPVKMAAHP